MRHLRYILFIVLLPVLFVSCTERVNIELDESYVRLVVDGSITTDTIAHKVILSGTSGYFYNQPPEMISGAKVSISDGSSAFVLSEETPGIYSTNPSVYGVPGRKYTLEIQLASPIGGYTAYSASSILNTVAPMDSIALEFLPDWSRNGFWAVKCYVLEPPTTDFYRFLISKNNKIVTDTLFEWFITDDKFFNGNYTFGATIGYLNQSVAEQRLMPGDIVTAEVNGIGKEYAEFLWDAQSELRGSNPLFSGPRANVKGNINNGAVGFFAAYSVNRAYAVTKYKK